MRNVVPRGGKRDEMTKRMTKRDYCTLVNETAALLHLYQGKVGHVLPDSFFDAAVGRLTEHYQHNFMGLTEIDGKLKYVVFPVKLAVSKTYEGVWAVPVFEVQWLIRALLGIALCRQALVIHREPKGPEPADSDKRLVKLLNQFIRQANPEIITRDEEETKEQEIAASVPQKAG